MPAPTQQELALQAKYAKLRRKQEEQAKSQNRGSTTASASQAHCSTGPPSLPKAAPTSAQERAKALLAKKLPTDSGAASSVKPAAPAVPVDTKAAAKLLLASKTAKAGTARGLQQPSLKRPSVHRARQKPAPVTGQVSTFKEQSLVGSDATRQDWHLGHEDGQKRLAREDGWCTEGSRVDEERSRRPQLSTRRDDEHSAKRARYDLLEPARRGTRQDGESTIFVGDLPPDFSEEEVAHLFAPFGALQEVRVMGSYCYAFVTFRNEDDATEVIRRFATHPMTAGGHRLRINRAYGHLPDWKRGPTGPQKTPSGNFSGSKEHPKACEARLAGAALASQIQVAGMHGINIDAPPQERMLVTYDDL